MAATAPAGVLQIPITAAVFASRQAQLYSQVAATVWFAYDVCLTVDVEIANIWRAKWSLPKVLFIIVRYWGLFSLFCNLAISFKPHPTADFCIPWLRFSALNTVVLIGGAINMLLLVRLYGLFGRSRTILLSLSAVYLVELSLDIASNTMRKPLPIFFVDPSGASQPGCVNWAFAPIGMLYATQALCLFRAALYFGLTVYRTITFVSNGESASSRELLRRARRNLRLGPVIALFLRDETAIFLCILLIQVLFSVMTYTSSLHAYSGSVYPFLGPVLAIASTRLVLNLKDTGARARERPVSLFVAAPGPGGPIELRTADFMRRTASTRPGSDRFGGGSFGRASYDALAADKTDEDEARDAVIDLRPLKRGLQVIDEDNLEHGDATVFKHSGGPLP